MCVRVCVIQEAVGIESLVLRAFLVEQDALGFHTVSQVKDTLAPKERGL